ncbi:hypothetical protein LMG3458_02472 [Achromobacter deleyi]|uniref:Uncharacterized protein n=1 Tax=Achromobacter deleyi TaxID=1353891 RepID=A0A6S6ZYW7_9BURK|nr:hypothetical protein [Achromobacter deleyi]CAB3697605.1 hypothetical protein LMG3458_02472 [Achromobacter deleyi]
MTARFKSGDKVRCEVASASGQLLARGRIYTVEHVDMGSCKLAGVSGEFGTFRFEALPQAGQGFDLALAQSGYPLKFRSGCPVKFIAYIPEAKPHCQLVLLNPATGNTVTRYANGKASTEPYDEPGDILVA